MNIMILGCGQHSRMLALEGKKLNYNFTFVAIEDEPTECVDGLGLILNWYPHMSTETLIQASGIPDVVTVENENIDSKFLFELSLKTKVYPSPESVSVCQNRLKEKLALTKANIPVTPWLPVNDRSQLESAVVGFGFPCVVKTTLQGDGRKTQWRIHNNAQLDELIENEEPKDWIVEPMIDFNTEASIIAARSSTGQIALYPITENFHKSGILRRSVAPIENISKSQSMDIKNYVIRLLESWNYVGVLTMELFIKENEIMVNKLVPRVHNSGHWTLNQTTTSQFENHLRAISGVPLGDTKSETVNGMINILGRPSSIKIDENFEGELTMYNRKHRAGRKLGHLSFSDNCRLSLLNKMEQAKSHI